MTDPRKPTSFKLNADEQRDLAYLSLVSHQNGSEVVRQLIELMATTVQGMARYKDPDATGDPDLMMNGSDRYLVTMDEQRAWTWLVTGIEKIRDHGRTWWAVPL